jgi:hypothetical protein
MCTLTALKEQKGSQLFRIKWFFAIFLLILPLSSQVWAEWQYLSEARVKELTQRMTQPQWIDGILRWNEGIGGYHIVALDLAQGDKTVPTLILNQNADVLRNLVGRKVHFEGLVDPQAVNMVGPKLSPPEPVLYLLLTGFATDYIQIPGKLSDKWQVTPYQGDTPPIKGLLVK